jgi:hypothetical protein
LNSTFGFLIVSQQGPMILRLSTKISKALVFVPKILEILGLQAPIGTAGSVIVSGFAK